MTMKNKIFKCKCGNSQFNQSMEGVQTLEFRKIGKEFEVEIIETDIGESGTNIVYCTKCDKEYSQDFIENSL